MRATARVTSSPMVRRRPDEVVPAGGWSKDVVDVGPGVGSDATVQSHWMQSTVVIVSGRWTST